VQSGQLSGARLGRRDANQQARSQQPNALSKEYSPLSGRVCLACFLQPGRE